MSGNVSIITTLKNRSHLFKYCLDAISRCEYDLSKIEVCVVDSFSTDSLLSIIDRFSDVFKFKYVCADRLKSYLPIVSNCPATEYNLACKYVASHEKILKIDPEIIITNDWLLSEVNGLLDKDDTRMYNARVHFTEGEGWFQSVDDIIKEHEKHYHYAESGPSPFSRSKFYFLSAFSKSKFLELRGVEEMFTQGCGYEDTHLRDVWKNHFGSYEYEISAGAVHLWHGGNKSRPAKEVANSRLFEHLKTATKNNVVRIKGGKLVYDENTPYANPEMLSKIYTIKDGSIIGVEDVNGGNSVSLDLPF